MSKTVLATGNAGKVSEMQQTLSEFGFDIVPQSEFNVPEAVEDGLTFVENALIKARHACELTGLAAIADDSGIEVDALNGAPGIYSARYAGAGGAAANNEKLLKALSGESNRTARFVCVIVFLQHANDPTPLICQGFWEGSIAESQTGENGFGYDPLFFVPEHQCSAAGLSAEQKKNLSHRAKALRSFQQQLEQLRKQ